jgi:hypothetical protein
MDIQYIKTRPEDKAYGELLAGVGPPWLAPEWLLEDVATLIGRGVDSSVSPAACKEAVALLAWVFRARSFGNDHAYKLKIWLPAGGLKSATS